MKFNNTIPKLLLVYYKEELRLYQTELNQGNLQCAWKHLERAHIIGQAFPVQHTLAHWKMLLFAFKIKNIKEIFGQLPRLFVGGIKSFVGKIPVGNTGGANVPPLRSMPISPDILDLFKKAGYRPT